MTRFTILCITVVFLFGVAPPALADLPGGGNDPAAPLTIHSLWILLAAAMVFFMQAGFLAIEAGSVREKAAGITALKNLSDWVICAASFFLFGWAIMFGRSNGFIGTDLFGLWGDSSGGHALGLSIHFLFQLAFAATAATIVSGAIAERTSYVAYLLCTFVIATFIYPVIGHWTWGDSFFAGNKPLLSHLGFLDFAGSTVVHSVGGWVALVGIMMVGPRIGRFGADGKVNDMRPHSIVTVTLGVLILWFGWWGFNGGSTLALDGRVGGIIINTNIAGAFGALGALLHCAMMQEKRYITVKFLNGALAGLVGITAGCAFVNPLAAAFIGLSSGILCNLAADLLLHFKLDDPVGAVPVHLAAGIWGTLCVGLFGDASLFPNGNSRLEQIGAQLAGIAICGLWAGGVSWTAFYAIRRWVGLRVSPQEEIHGFDIAGEIVSLPEEDPMDEAMIRELMASAASKEQA